MPSLAPDLDLLAPEATPRRRRNGAVCGSLRIDGQPMTFAGLTALDIRFTPGVLNDTRLNLHELRCTERHDAVGAGWVADICTSSWQRDCPFAVSDAPATVVRYAFALPDVAVDPPQKAAPAHGHRLPATPAEHARREALATAVITEIARRGIQKRWLAYAMGMAKGYVNHAICMRQPGPLAAIQAYLGTLS